jgi:hypothetical protein
MRSNWEKFEDYMLIEGLGLQLHLINLMRLLPLCENTILNLKKKNFNN